MFHNLFSSTSFFRILNFAVFIGFFIFLFKRYLLPTIKKQIQEKKLLLQNLEQQKQGIKYQQSNLDNAIEQQKHLAEELNKKINLWQEKVTQQQEHEDQQKKILLEKMHEKILKQSQEQNLIELNKQIIPKVLVQVNETLTQRFSSSDLGQPFIKDIVAFIQESNT